MPNANAIGILVRETIQNEFELCASVEHFELLVHRVLQEAEVFDQELSILFTDNQEMQELNSHFRSKDSPTDVLAFSGVEGEEMPDIEPILGDVVISLPYAKKQAAELGVSIQEELMRLLIHGVLHLLGYDHEIDEQEAEKMFKEQERILELVKPSFQQ